MSVERISVGFPERVKYNLFFILEHFLGQDTVVKLFGKKVKNLQNQISNKINTNGTGTFEVSQADPKMQPEEFISRRNLVSPVVFRQAAAEWTCTKKWTLDFFEENYGDREIILNDHVGLVDSSKPQEFQTLHLRDYIQQLKEGSLKYLKFSNLVQNQVALQSHLDLKWLKKFVLPASSGETFYAFIGGKGSITPVHNELPCVVYVQVYGKKKWILYQASDRVFLDPRTERRNYFYSNADPNKIDDPNYPLLKHARKYEVVLEPGDVLWMSPFTWHHVENLSHSIGVAYKFANLKVALQSSKVLTLLIFLSTKPNLLYSFLMTRLRKNDYALMKKAKNY